MRYRGNVCTSRLPSKGFDLRSAVSSVRHSKGIGSLGIYVCNNAVLLQGWESLATSADVCCLQATSVSIMYVIIMTELGVPSYVS